MHYVLTDEFGERVVLRVKLSGKTPVAKLREQARRFFEKALEKKTAGAIRSKAFGLALLAATPERKTQLEKAFSKDSELADYRVTIGLGPTAEVLSQFLKSRKRG